jgi:hypothetical protein
MRVPTPDVLDHMDRNPGCFGNLGLGIASRLQCSNMKRLTARYRCFVMSAFSTHIGHVVGMRSNEQMRWVDAAPIVAGMANHHARCDRAMDQNPCDSMSIHHLPLEGKRGISSGTHHRSSPKPTLPRFINGFPKAAVIRAPLFFRSSPRPSKFRSACLAMDHSRFFLHDHIMQHVMS